jgi:hypothetical protein
LQAGFGAAGIGAKFVPSARRSRGARFHAGFRPVARIDRAGAPAAPGLAGRTSGACNSGRALHRRACATATGMARRCGASRAVRPARRATASRVAQLENPRALAVRVPDGSGGTRDAPGRRARCGSGPRALPVRATCGVVGAGQREGTAGPARAPPARCPHRLHL